MEWPALFFRRKQSRMLGKKESKSDGELRRKHWFCIRGSISAGPHAPSTPGPLIRHKVYFVTSIYSFHITWWPWKPVQLDDHLDWLHFDTCGFLNNYTCTCIWNWHDFFKFRVSKCNQSKWPFNCIGFHGHHVMWNPSIHRHVRSRSQCQLAGALHIEHHAPCTCTAWCSEIGSLTSLDAWKFRCI